MELWGTANAGSPGDADVGLLLESGGGGPTCISRPVHDAYVVPKSFQVT
jgi:hypothetical protein